MKKRILSVLIILSLFLPLLVVISGIVLADEGDGEEVTVWHVVNDDKHCLECEDCLEDACPNDKECAEVIAWSDFEDGELPEKVKDGHTLVIVEDYEDDEPRDLKIPADKVITIQGYASPTSQTTLTYEKFHITCNADTLTLKDITISGMGNDDGGIVTGVPTGGATLIIEGDVNISSEGRLCIANFASIKIQSNSTLVVTIAEDGEGNTFRDTADLDIKFMGSNSTLIAIERDGFDSSEEEDAVLKLSKDPSLNNHTCDVTPKDAIVSDGEIDLSADSITVKRRDGTGVTVTLTENIQVNTGGTYYIPPYQPPYTTSPPEDDYEEPITPQQPEPEPFSSDQTLALDADALDALFENAVDGVMVMVIEGDLTSLQIDVPLSWFMENLGATLLVYNANLGLLAITSENMIELAVLAYEGTGGVTVVIHGREMTFNPDTIISYKMVKGSINLAVTANGNTLDWYVYDSPVILGIPGNLAVNADLWVAVETLGDGGEKIIPRSQARDGLMYALVNSEGTFKVKYNEVFFEDIENGWMESAVQYMAARGIVKGVGDNLYMPERTVTRAEYTAMLMRAMDYQMSGYDPAPFSDVLPDSWYYEYVCKAAALGITVGIGGGRFGPDNIITREDMFTLTYNALTKFWLLIPDEEMPEFPEGIADISDISDYAERAVAELMRNGLVSGSQNSIRPKDASSRAEAAQFLSNVIKYIIPDYSEYIINADS